MTIVAVRSATEETVTKRRSRDLWPVVADFKFFFFFFGYMNTIITRFSVCHISTAVDIFRRLLGRYGSIVV